MWKKRLSSLLLAVFAVLVAVSCTTERSAVDKTDELALDKRLFEGEFFVRQTIIDLPYTADYAFIGESNNGKIIKWKITENWLIGYSIWDKLTSIDSNEIIDVNETPVVAYPIAMHYDIVPSENPTTGEALPVLVANTDRPWNERRYFSLVTNSISGVTNRELQYLNLTVEWGAPFFKGALTTATDFEFYAHDGTYIQPKKYRDYTALTNDQERFNKEVEWFQFTSTEYFEPIGDWSTIYNWDDIDEFIGNEPAAVTYRFVFSKVNRDVVGKRDYDLATKKFTWTKGSKDNGFRPLEYPDEMFREYGFFTNKFKGYDNYHGYREDNFHTLANYWNMAWADSNKKWNFTCTESPENYNECLKKIKYQQKIVFVSSPKTPLRMIPANCAIAKDYNYAMLGARFAAMNPGSDTRMFEKWYYENYKNDFFKEIKTADGGTAIVRDTDWYVKDLNDPNNPHSATWKEKCFVPDKQAWIQNWDGSFVDETGDVSAEDLASRVNDIVVLVENPVESYVPARDGKALYGFGNYYNFSSEDTSNAVKICVLPEEADQYDEEKVSYFSTCKTNNDKMSELYMEAGIGEYGATWRGDRWDCQIYAENESCPEGYVEAKAACVLTAERTCQVEAGLPVLRHKYDNGNPYAALINWVEKPTEYGILGVSQWNVNPETGMSLGGGSNIAGSVLAWCNTRGIELAKMIIDQDDPAAWDWKDLINPDYQNTPSVIWDNNATTSNKKDEISLYNKKTNLMRMIKEARPQETVEERVARFNEEYQMKTRKYDRFDFTSLIGNSKWETKMIPYSIKKNLFPWMNPADNPAYTDEQKEIMQPWYVGPAAMEAQIIRYLKAKALDFDFDESFMDGSILQFIKDKQRIIRKEMGLDEDQDWSKVGDEVKDAYAKKLMYAIYDELEKLQYKGVAEHEMGHTLGLRHNFAGSTDVRNYADSYYAPENYPEMMEGLEKLYKEESAKSGFQPATFGRKAYRFKKAFMSSGDNEIQNSPLTYHTYTSVMDYQRELYIHSLGLGKYDLAALKFVYGRSFEKVAVKGGGAYGELIHQGEAGDEYGWVNPIRDPRYPDYIRTNEQYLDNNGELIKVKVPTKLYVYYDNEGKKVEALAPNVKMSLDVMNEGLKKTYNEDKGEYEYAYDFDCDKELAQCMSDITYLVNDGSHYEYTFVTDEKSSDDPKANTFDAGYMASDIIRGMADMDDAYYFLRFFRRGNPKFREFRGRTSMKMIYDTLFSKYKYIHFLLDYNFYAYGKWGPYILGLYEPGNCTETFPIPTSEEPGTEKKVKNYLCEELQRAFRGEEYWIDDYGNFRTNTPMGPADHVIAGMEGANYFYYDVLYRPAVGAYMQISGGNDPDINDKMEGNQGGYYQSMDNYIDGYADIAPGVIQITPLLGRFQKDRYDIQDNEQIYYDKVLRRAYAEEKMVAIYAIANSGWFDAKYRRESRANTPDQMFTGLENVKFTMLSDVMDEEALFSFSPYCVNSETKAIAKVDVPVNILTNWGAFPEFAAVDENGNQLVQQGSIYNFKKNLCSQVGEKWLPIHAGWTYFDKMWPMYWAMGNVANMSADTSVYERFIAYKIPAYDITNYPEPDVNEAQFLNKDGNNYYRAVLPTSALDSQDGAGLTAWKTCREEKIRAGENDFTDCLAKVGYSKSGAAAANAELGLALFNEGNKEDSANPEKCIHVETGAEVEVERCIHTGDPRFPSVEGFRKYLSDKYSRLAPSFRLVQSAGILKQSELDDMSEGKEGYTRLVIMETTLDQMNAFAVDNLGLAPYYVSRY